MTRRFEKRSDISRRGFLQAGASLALAAGMGRWSQVFAQTATDYKALVCVFLFGGNDGHNTIVPLSNGEHAAYLAARPGLGLPMSDLLTVSDAQQGDFGFHYAAPELRDLFTSGHLAVVANVGQLVRPTTYAQFVAGSSLPQNLRSHSDQVLQMQTAVPTGGGTTGWGGRAVDLMEFKYSYNSATNFPRSVSINGPATFGAGAIVQGVSLQPGNFLSQNGMPGYPVSAAQARSAAQLKMVSTTTGKGLVDSANKVLADAIALQPILQGAAGSVSFTKAFPQTTLGKQLEEIARVIVLSPGLGVGRQVFFCGLGGFDTHAGQDYQQEVLLSEVSQALDAFYAATVQHNRANDVTAFTLSDFGRTLQPSGSGCDHGWGNHHFVVGGAVQGGRIYGRFPRMSNYLNFNATAEDYADARGTLLPHTSLSQYAATFARWFGAADGDLNGMLDALQPFTQRNLGFLG